MRTFLEVADAGGVSPAARRLGVSKSIASRRLARLEQALGVQLLSRTTHGAVLTEAGATFREHAARIVAELDSAQEAVSPAGDLRGLLRIAAPLSFGPRHLAPVFAELARRHPLLHVAPPTAIALSISWEKDSTQQCAWASCPTQAWSRAAFV